MRFLAILCDFLSTIFWIFYNSILLLISGKSIVSIKKVLSYLTFFLICYIAIYTDKNYGELIVFLGVLLGIRSYDKQKYVEIEEKKYNSVGFKMKEKD
jgi:hypothetical protein